MSIQLGVIGVVRTPWPDKFGVPRQSGLSTTEATIVLDPELVSRDALRGLEGISHLWIVSVLHGLGDGATGRPTVRPPRLGGSTRLGVFATRSPHRPNPIGLSVVRLLAIEDRTLRITGVDLLDNTPVLDLKPYLPWADIVPSATCEWASGPPDQLQVEFSAIAEAWLANDSRLRAMIVDTLTWDPRPAHQRESVREYAARVGAVDVRFRVVGQVAEVLQIEGVRIATA